MNGMVKSKQYEVRTSLDDPFDMPHQVFARTRKDAIKQIKAKKNKNEKILSVKRSYWK